MLARLKQLGARPRAPLFAVLVAIVLLLPTLGSGLFADDITHQILLKPGFRLPGGPRGAWDLFRFIGPDRTEFREALDTGFWPWWSAPNLRVGFFRPISALLHAFDYRVLHGTPWLLHAESLALYAGIGLAAALLYRRLVAPAWAATLAALLFAVDDAHSLTVVWVANRNALVAGFFAFFALVAHDRARRDGHRPSAVVAPILFALGLLGGEAAVAALAYLVAYALWLDDAPPRSRALSLAPYAAVLVAYVAVYKALGYGAIGSGFYLDPATEPLPFAAAVAMRLPVLLLAQLAAPPSDLWQVAPPDRALLLVAGTITVIAAIVLVLARTLRGDRTARFFATGMVLSLVPVCATWPNDRLLLFSGLGGFGLVALLLARVAQGAGSAPRSARVLAYVFVALHLVMAPVLLPLRALAFASFYGDYVARAERTIGALMPNAEGKVLVVVNAPDLLITGYAGGVRILRGEVEADQVRVLATAIDGNDGEVERIDERSLAITLRRGFVDDAFAKLVRGSTVRFTPGEVIALAGLRIEIGEVNDDHRPLRVVFRFDRPLDDPRFVWTTWKGTGYSAWRPPPIAARVALPAIGLLKAMFGAE